MAQSYLGKLVQVEWEDAYGCASNWETIKDIKPEAAVAMTAGWVFAETDSTILVIPHRVTTFDDEQGCGDMVIPRSCILHIRELRIVEAGESNGESMPPTQPVA